MKLLEPQMSTPPHLFRCPISLELFKDPVTLCTGQTYDRPFIEKWLSSGNLTCPVTMQKLTDLSLIPNLTLTHLINQWLNQTTRSTKNYNDNPSSLNLISTPPYLENHRNHEKFLSELKQTLESEEPDWTKKKKLHALKQLKSLFLELPNREDEIESLVKLGFFPVLIRLVFHDEIIENHHLIRENFELVELALSSAVKIMPYCELDCLNTMIKAEWVLKRLMECGTPKVIISLSHFIESILSSPQTKELASVLSSSGDVLRFVINQVDADDDREQVNQDKFSGCEDKDSEDEESNALISEAGVKIILALISTATRDGQEDNKRITVLKQLVELGAVQSLTRCVWRANRKKGISVVGSSKRITAALKAVEMFLKVEGGKEALLGEENGVRAIVGVVFRVTTTSDHEGSENAVNCLLSLCCDSTEAIREKAVKEGVLTQLLLLLQSQCSGRTKTRARLLLKVLRGTRVTKHRLFL